jgi:hypothetical protein
LIGPPTNLQPAFAANAIAKTGTGHGNTGLQKALHQVGSHWHFDGRPALCE